MVLYYDISTTVGYLMLNPIYNYDFKVNSLLVKIFKTSQSSFYLHNTKCIQVFLLFTHIGFKYSKQLICSI